MGDIQEDENGSVGVIRAGKLPTRKFGSGWGTKQVQRKAVIISNGGGGRTLKGRRRFSKNVKINSRAARGSLSAARRRRGGCWKIPERNGAEVNNWEGRKQRSERTRLKKFTKVLRTNLAMLDTSKKGIG